MSKMPWIGVILKGDYDDEAMKQTAGSVVVSGGAGPVNGTVSSKCVVEQ
jgi:hypothetical protein